MNKTQESGIPAMRVTAPGKLCWNSNELTGIDWSEADFVVCIHDDSKADSISGTTALIPKTALLRLLHAVKAMERFSDELAF
jgi:hypothetical protein